MSEFDLVIRSGSLYDGSGDVPWSGDVAVRDGRIAAIGAVPLESAPVELDAGDLAVAPGFINMMSWAMESLIEDGRSMSDIRQGVTLEVFGEGWSMGPLNNSMRTQLLERGVNNAPERYRYPVDWTSLCEYLEWLEARGISTNVASFVGAGTLRIHEVGYKGLPATDAQLARMCDLLRWEMEHGAMGVASALIYPPETAWSTQELIVLAAVVAEYDGLYASHIRSEGDALLEAVQEFIDIAAGAQVRAEVYHLKAAGRSNWVKLKQVVQMMETARTRGLVLTADMYPYDSMGTDLNACIPPWAHEGGTEELVARLQDPRLRARIRDEMRTASKMWENMYVLSGPEQIIISGSLVPSIGPVQGSTLAQIASERGRDPADTLMDLLVENGGSIFSLYVNIAEGNLRRQVRLPWVSFSSDAESLAAEGRFLGTDVHPRAYGSFVRVLGRYVRDEGLIPLEEAIRKMTSLPADNLRLKDRGRLKVGNHADIVVFDREKVKDHATLQDPHRYATGIKHVIVNGAPVLLNCEHTGATPGRFVRGPGAS